MGAKQLANPFTSELQSVDNDLLLPLCSKNTPNQGLGLKSFQTGPVKMIHFPVRPGLKWNNEIHFKVEQICTGGGNILKPALARCAKQIDPERGCEGNGGGDWCVWMCRESIKVCEGEMAGFEKGGGRRIETVQMNLKNSVRGRFVSVSPTMKKHNLTPSFWKPILSRRIVRHPQDSWL